MFIRLPWFYEFELRNTGSESIDLPVDPSPRDVEPARPAVQRYQYVSATVALEFGADSAGIKAEPLRLYGSESARGSRRLLAPGSAIRIRAKANLMETSLAANGAPITVHASFALYRSSVKGDTLEDRQIMGPVESSNALQLAVR